MRFLADAGVSPKTVEFLRQLGHEAVHVRALGLQRATDPELVARAREDSSVVLTFDLDFGDVLALGVLDNVRRDNGGFVLTDGGETIQDLRASGCDLETTKRRDLLTAVLNGFGVRREGEALVAKATPQDFSLRKHNLVQAILA